MTDKYAVVGNPIEHSLSPQIHHLFAKATHQDIVYEKQLIAPGNFKAAIHALIKTGVKGVNVTVPFKQDAFTVATDLSEAAKAAGAVNTLSFIDNNQIVGDNTDGAGLVKDIKTNLGFSLQHKNILLVGAGGAARGVILPLLHAHPKSLTLTNRTIEKAYELQQNFKNKFQVIASTKLNEPYDIIINATSMGLQARQAFFLNPAILTGNTLCYDMMYGKPSAFLEWAYEHKAGLSADGLGMLVEQAALAFEVWRKVLPKTKEVLAQMRKDRNF